MDQKLLGNKTFRRSLGKASMCWGQPTRVDHMCKKMRAERRRKILQGRTRAEKAGDRPAGSSPCQPLPLFFQFFDFFD
jgi:hypothetical protein